MAHEPLLPGENPFTARAQLEDLKTVLRHEDAQGSTDAALLLQKLRNKILPRGKDLMPQHDSSSTKAAPGLSPRIPDNILFNYKYDVLQSQSNDPEDRRMRRNVEHTVSLFRGSGHDPHIIFWDDTQCRTMLGSIRAELAVRFDGEPDGRLRSDMCRLAQLYKHGGYYFDLDIVPRFDVRSILAPGTTFATCLTNDWIDFNPDGFFQAFLAATPEHPVILRAMLLHLEWYQSVDEHDLPSIMHVTNGRKKANVGTVLLRDAWIKWAGVKDPRQQAVFRHQLPADGSLRGRAANAGTAAAAATSAGVVHTSHFFHEKHRKQLSEDYRRKDDIDLTWKSAYIDTLCDYVVVDPAAKRVVMYSRVSLSGNEPRPCAVTM